MGLISKKKKNGGGGGGGGGGGEGGGGRGGEEGEGKEKKWATHTYDFYILVLKRSLMNDWGEWIGIFYSVRNHILFEI